MSNKLMLTRREAIEGLMGAAATAMLAKSAAAERPVNIFSADASVSNSVTLSEWRFYRGDAKGAEAADFNDSAWRALTIPHDWSIEDLPVAADSGTASIWTGGSYPTHIGPFDMYASEGQIATGWTVGGTGWYRTILEKPAVVPGGRVELRFEGVYMNCDVWLNGVLLGNHPYGYTEFAYDVTPHLKDGGNVVAVKVNNTGRNSRWYSGSGLFRKVRLNVQREIRIPAHHVFVTMPEVSAEKATVSVVVDVENGAAQSRKANVRVRLFDQSGAAGAVFAAAPLTIVAGGAATATCHAEIANPHLWSPDTPYLYRAEVQIESGGKVVDAAELNIGIRKVEIDAARGLRVNGESVKLRGGCVHHDNGILGSACIPRAEERRVEILKANGFNAIRTSHNPPSRDFLDACDRLGMLVIDEAFDCWESGNKNPQDYHLYFKDWWQRDLTSMILRDRNHPCVILWSIGNEINERAEPHGVEIGKALAAEAHKLDPTRKVTAAICAAWDHPHTTWQELAPAFTYLDVGGYNYEWQEYENDHAKFPERVMMGTESFPNQAYENWRAVEKNSFVLGDFVWTAIDYLGESGIGHASIHSANAFGGSQDVFTPPYPWFNSYCGDIDLIGNKKPQSYFRDVVWRRSKVEMAVQRPLPESYTEHISMWGWSDELRSWTWSGHEGAPINVRVYTRGDKVRLLVNGREVGTKNLTDKDLLRAEFTVPYEAGELKAIAYDGASEIGTVTFTTAGKPHRLVLAPDRETIKIGTDDLSYIMAQVIDADGRPVPDAVVPVSFSLTGPGEIAAVGNANPKDVASFRQPMRNTFHGVCVAVVRPAGKSGSIEVLAESPGLRSGRATITAG